MKKSYQRPEIWIEEMAFEGSIADGIVSNVKAKGSNGEDLGFVFGGGSSTPARADENNLWDDDEEDSGWN